MDISTAVRPVAGSPRWMREAAGWLAFISALMLLALAVPAARFDPGSGQFLLFIGAIGIWRYSLGILHFLRGMLFLYWVFPRLRRKASALGETAMPSRVYLMITSFRIEAEIRARLGRRDQLREIERVEHTLQPYNLFGVDRIGPFRF